MGMVEAIRNLEGVLIIAGSKTEANVIGLLFYSI